MKHFLIKFIAAVVSLRFDILRPQLCVQLIVTDILLIGNYCSRGLKLVRLFFISLPFANLKMKSRLNCLTDFRITANWKIGDAVQRDEYTPFCLLKRLLTQKKVSTWQWLLRLTVKILAVLLLFFLFLQFCKSKPSDISL